MTSALCLSLPAGKLGLWVPPYPTRAGAVYTLQRLFDAHGTGVVKCLADGTQVSDGSSAQRQPA